MKFMCCRFCEGSLIALHCVGVSVGGQMVEWDNMKTRMKSIFPNFPEFEVLLKKKQPNVYHFSYMIIE